MAGMEQLEIHSRDYLVRWVNVSGGHTISWSLQPRKKTINFGIFRRDSTNADQHTAPSASATLLGLGGAGDTTPDLRSKRHANSTMSPNGNTPLIVDKLEKMGMKSVAWTGRCEADRVSMGQYEVPPEAGEGMYGMVFDNTYSKQFSKSVTFVLMTYPSNAAPKSGHHMHLAQAMGSRDALGSPGVKRSPKVRARSESSGSLDGDGNRVVLADPRPRSAHATESVTSLGGSFYTGVLSKKRRKRNQGYARRFFSLDFTSSTLSYYKNRNSSALRGAIPLSLAVVGANEKARQISVDSGTEIWLLKAPNQQDFDGWLDAIRRASSTEAAAQTQPASLTATTGTAHPVNPAEERDWKHVEELVGRVAGTTDAMRRLARDTDPQYLPNSRQQHFSDPMSPTDGAEMDYFGGGGDESKQERRPFWRRKSSNQTTRTTYKRNTSNQRLAPPSPDPSISSENLKRYSSLPSNAAQQEYDVHGHCMQILRDLDAVVASFSSLITQSRQRRQPPGRPEPVSRTSLDSIDGQDFFDAKESRDDAGSAFFTIGSRDTRDEEAEGDPNSERHRDDDDAASIDSTSTISNPEIVDRPEDSRLQQHALFPRRPHSLYPLPHPPVARRTTINPAKGAPPSLISFLRKNVGKDLSTIAMPVTANEPLSLLQRSAETLENAHLLNTAASITQQTQYFQARRLLYIAAFAISPLANTRAKERAVRKPFNPMLGETYELVREDLGFRFFAEKVSHRPVRIAFQAEGGPPTDHTTTNSQKSSTPPPAAAWTHTHAPAPSQKFWGKSAELLTSGRARVRLHDLNENYSWQAPQCFLRNVIAGEKYVEPAGSMTIIEETSGRRAVVTFKSGGMFSGRSEEVVVEAFDGGGGSFDGAAHGARTTTGTGTGRKMPLSLAGKWTTSLALLPSSTEHQTPSNSHSHSQNNNHDTHHPGHQPPHDPETIWSAPPLTSSPSKHYGLTLFGASLNEITPLESRFLPPTDSRLRPDQRAYEDGDVEGAERLKGVLEERQRERRSRGNGIGGGGKGSRWFEKVERTGVGGGGGDADEDGEEVWRMKEGVDDPPPPPSPSSPSSSSFSPGMVEQKTRNYWDVRQAVAASAATATTTEGANGRKGKGCWEEVDGEMGEIFET